jgi:hypothetical protein
MNPDGSETQSAREDLPGLRRQAAALHPAPFRRKDSLPGRHFTETDAFFDTLISQNSASQVAPNPFISHGM